MSLKLTSSLFGEIEYNEQEVYQFEHGVPGFLDHTSFIFVKVEDSPFTVMHSITDDLYFFLMDPFTIFPDYEFTIPDHIIEQLAIEQEEQVICYLVVVLREPLSDSTANMVAPVIINTENRKGIQLVLENAGYSVRQPIFLSSEEKGYNDSEDIAEAAAANQQQR